jgi:hypothetical protein
MSKLIFSSKPPIPFFERPQKPDPQITEGSKSQKSEDRTTDVRGQITAKEGKNSSQRNKNKKRICLSPVHPASWPH